MRVVNVRLTKSALRPVSGCVRITDIRMPELAVGDLRIAMRGDDEHLGIAGHPRCRRMHVQIAKHPSDRDVHVGRNFRLLLEEEHAELQERVAHLTVRRGIESS
jgi:hypothetical protein